MSDGSERPSGWARARRAVEGALDAASHRLGLRPDLRLRPGLGPRPGLGLRPELGLRPPPGQGGRAAPGGAASPAPGSTAAAGPGPLTAEDGAAAARGRRRLFDAYVAAAPSAQNAVDAVPGWVTALPPEAGAHAGSIPLFADERIAWAIAQAGGVAGKRVLELGPLDGGHTVMLTRAGAQVDAVEANRLAYLRCLVTKELLGLTTARFHLGDFVAFLEAEESRAQAGDASGAPDGASPGGTSPDESPRQGGHDGLDESGETAGQSGRAQGGEPRWDLIVASGVLYHMRDPVRLLELLARRGRAVYLWTHYYDPAAMTPKSLRPFHRKPVLREYKGRTLRLWRRTYRASPTSISFCGGMEDEHYWMERQDIEWVLGQCGMAVSFSDRAEGNAMGPCLGGLVGIPGTELRQHRSNAFRQR